MRLAIVFAIVLSLRLPAGAVAPAAQVDHILLGIDDLDRGMEQFEKLTGVRPVYGGKHPRGTHNALVSLGNGTYLESWPCSRTSRRRRIMQDLEEAQHADADWLGRIVQRQRAAAQPTHVRRPGGH